MKKILPFICLSLLSLMWMPACKNAPMAENAIAFDSIVIQNNIPLLENVDDPCAELNIRFVYPVKVKNKDLLAAIQNIFVVKTFSDDYAHLTPADAVTAYELAYTSEYQELKSVYLELKKEFDDLESFSYYEDLGTNIIFHNANLLSFNVTQDTYAGGAHGSELIYNHVIDLKTGNLLTTEDVFGDNMNELTLQILKKLMEQENVSTIKELEDVGFFDVDSITPNDNFSITGEGITFFYNQYEIAPYSSGVIEVFLPFGEIKTLIVKNSPVFGIAGL
jgi:hypothetical protein